MKKELSNKLKSFVASKSYVEFDADTGNLLSVRSSLPDEGSNYIEVDFEKIKLLKEGVEQFHQYIVEYNGKTKSLELKYRNELDFDNFLVNEFIYKIPVEQIIDADITIVQDIDNTCWKILIGKELKRSLIEKGISLNSVLYFSITAKNDPNVLYKQISCNFAESIRNSYYIVPFSEKFEYEISDISVYTVKLFDTYQFKRIKNGKEA